MAINPNAVLQYIGARYVPKFYENPDTGDATWKSGIAYEGFMVVTYQQNSYTSKIPVPATVGDPSSNSDYWVKTADWNAQLNALQQQVNNINTEINERVDNIINAAFLQNKKIVAYGDSTVYVGGGQSSYMDYVAAAVDAQFTNRAVPGTGIVDSTAAIASSTDLPSFDVIYIGHGIAEFNGNINYNTLKTRVTNLINTIRSKSSTITILFAIPYYIYNNFNDGFPVVQNWRGMDMETFNNWFIKILNELKVPYYNFYTRSTCNKFTYTQKLLNDSGGIYVHPNEEFKKELASIVLNGVDVVYEKTKVPVLKDYDFTTARYRLTDLTAVAAVATPTEGYALKVLANETIISTPKILKGSYILHGTCSHRFAFSIGGNNYEVGSLTGNYDFDVKIELPYGSTTLTITASVDTIIANMQLYELTDEPDKAYYRFNGYYNPVFTPESGITQAVTLRCHLSNDYIVLESFTLTVSDRTQLTENQVIYAMPDHIDFGSRNIQLIGHSFNGHIMALNCIGNEIKISVPYNDTYFFEPHVISVDKQNYQG